MEHYRSQLEHRVLSRFDKAEAKKDTADMNACAAVMREMENSQSSSALVQVIKEDIGFGLLGFSCVGF